MKILKLIFSTLLSFSLVFFQMNLLQAKEKVTKLNVSNTNYELVQETRRNVVTFETDNIIHKVIANKDTGVIYLDNMPIGNYDLEIESPIKVARASSKNNPIKMNFKVTIAGIAAITAVLLSLPALTAAAASVGVSMSLLKTAVKTICGKIIRYYGTISALERYTGSYYVSGWISFELQRKGTLSRYANKKLYIKCKASIFSKSGTYSLGSGGWWSSTRPAY